MDPSCRSFLDALLAAHAPSGHEQPAARVWRKYAAAFADVTGDVLGNSYARVGPPSGPTALLLGHLDEIGMIVTHVIRDDSDQDGLLRVRPLGSWDPQVLVGQHALIRRSDDTVLPGVFGRPPAHLLDATHERGSRMEEVWLDIGATDADDAERMVQIGDPVVLDRAPRELANRRLSSRALDNRAGAWVAAEAARRAAARGLAVPVVAGAPVLEETLGDGARVMAHHVRPSVVVVIDVTHASDTPMIDPGGTGRIRLGHGPVLTRGLGLHPGLAQRFADVARDASLALQMEALSATSTTLTDVDGALDARGASATALISIPLRHMHSPSEVASLDDIDAAAELISRVLCGLTLDDAWEQ